MNMADERMFLENFTHEIQIDRQDVKWRRCQQEIKLLTDYQ